MHVCLEIAYDGTNYVGWQLQPPPRPTVQGVVERALEKLIGQPTRVMGASRTDSGVHALQQIAQFETDATVPADKYRLALLPHLPSDVVVTNSWEVDADFWILRAVQSKTYRYAFQSAAVVNPLLSRMSWRVPVNIDLEAMNEAASRLEGAHDFACFESTGSPRGTTVRTISHSRVTEYAAWSPIAMPAAADGGGRFLIYEVTGDGFLYNMVRSIAGTLVDIGTGRFPPEEMSRIVASRDRTRASATAPARGLTLARIEIDETLRSPLGDEQPEAPCD